jgi:hypothetical protein
MKTILAYDPDDFTFGIVIDTPHGAIAIIGTSAEDLEDFADSVCTEVFDPEKIQRVRITERKHS